MQGYYRSYDGMNLLKHALHNTCPDMMKSIGKDENGNDIKKMGLEDAILGEVSMSGWEEKTITLPDIVP